MSIKNLLPLFLTNNPMFNKLAEKAKRDLLKKKSFEFNSYQLNELRKFDEAGDLKGKKKYVKELQMRMAEDNAIKQRTPSETSNI